MELQGSDEEWLRQPCQAVGMRRMQRMPGEADERRYGEENDNMAFKKHSITLIPGWPGSVSVILSFSQPLFRTLDH